MPPTDDHRPPDFEAWLSSVAHADGTPLELEPFQHHLLRDYLAAGEHPITAGVRVRTSPLVPPGTALLVNTRALSLEAELRDWRPMEPEPLSWRSDAVDAMRYAFEARLSLGWREEEIPLRDPALEVPRRLRDWPRWLAAIVAHEVRAADRAYRRAAGLPMPTRRVPTDAARRSMVAITGLA